MPREGKVQHEQTGGNKVPKQPKGITQSSTNKPHQIKATTAKQPPTQNKDLLQA
jgi:hypothetical protein